MEDNVMKCKCKKKPSLLKRIVTPIAVMVGTEIIKEPLKDLFKNVIGSHMVKSFYLDSIRLDIYDFLVKYFKNIPSRFSAGFSINSERTTIEKKEMHTSYEIIGDHVDYAFIEGIPCKLTVESSAAGNRSINNTFISTLNINGYPARLEAIIKREAEKRANDPDRNKPCIRRITSSHNAILCSDAFVRDFDNVFVQKDVKDALTSALDSFMNNTDWYIKNSIPYHFGIMLYGPPGTGKTSIAQAISTYTNSNMYVVSGDDILKLPDILKGSCLDTYGLRKHDFNIILVEDVDCGLSYDKLMMRGMLSGFGKDEEDTIEDMPDFDTASDDEIIAFGKRATDMAYKDRERNPVKPKKTSKSGLASVLNSIDGIDAPRNTIFIFTTNHIDQLDPALIRPGRIDLMLEIKHVCPETFKEFMVKHFSEDVKIPKNLKVAPGLTFAKLQVMVMCGASANEVISFVRNPDEFIKKHSKENK